MTKAELLVRAAQELHVIADGQPLDAEPAAKLEDLYVSLWGLLAEHNLVTWLTTEEIPAKAELAMVMLMAAVGVGPFNVGGERKKLLLEMGAFGLPQMSLGERLLRGAMSSRYVSSPVRAPQY